MSWKEYLISEGYMYSEPNKDYRKGLVWGRSIKVAMIMKGLFEIKKDNKVVFSNFIESFDEFKKIVKTLLLSYKIKSSKN